MLRRPGSASTRCGAESLPDTQPQQRGKAKERVRKRRKRKGEKGEKNRRGKDKGGFAPA